MGNGCCGHEVVFSDFIEENQFDESKDIWREELDQRVRDFITNNNLQVWKIKKGDKYYCGKFNKGRSDGLAAVFVPGKFYFEGNFRNGLPDGLGYFKQLNQAQTYEEYQGSFKQGMAHGHGKLSNSNQQYGFYFEGQWQNSEVIKGRLRSLNSSELDYIDFSKSGNFIQFKNGDTYEGDLDIYFEPNGLGTFIYQNSNSTERYTGEWERGKFHGEGVCIWRDGSSYSGQYCNGEKQGQGKYIYASKKYYEGHWLEGMQHGQGTLYNEDGIVLEKGIWMKGKLEIKIDEVEEDKSKQFVPVTHSNQLQNLAEPHGQIS